jgi:hypothetical protein
MGPGWRDTWRLIAGAMLGAGIGALIQRSATVIVAGACIIGFLMLVLAPDGPKRFHWLMKWRFTKRSLRAGEKLRCDESLRSRNRRYETKMQDDGNLVTYGHTRPDATNTDGTGEAAYLDMQWDGNVVLYWRDGDHPLGATNTDGGSGRRLVLRNDGKLVLCNWFGQVKDPDVIDALRKDVEKRREEARQVPI